MLPPAQSDDSFEVALKWVNDGVEEMGQEEEYDDAANRGLSCGAQRSICRAVIGEGMSGGLDEIIQHHAAYAESQNLDPAMFAVVETPAWETEGILIVRIQPEISSFRGEVLLAGEMLNWIFISFLTWDQAKAWPDTASASASVSALPLFQLQLHRASIAISLGRGSILFLLAAVATKTGGEFSREVQPQRS